MTFKDISKHLPVRLHSGETASIDRMLERLGEELSASRNTHASDQQDLKVAGEKLRTLERDNARLEFRCASLFDQLLKSAVQKISQKLMKRSTRKIESSRASKPT